ncbi:ABC transporter permease [Rhizobium sp. S163]|uniref:ABC transporter permease n=1 Tax=Rhizobium sp. S163 TaxID=3055039 RepID=UPI0025A958E6|nr:ABC transporter permease [Rhizobium sp. S163]MDM9646677.1 ABC transporter permease [Rhizobium sp. S163]
MDPHSPAPFSFVSLLTSIWHNRWLVAQMVRREIVGRYKGSVIGIFWAFINPLILLVIYTFVFSVVFKARWGSTQPDGQPEFAVILFSGMIVHGLFAETMTRAPTLIVSNVNYVKKVIFPLEILPVVAMGTSIFHSLISFLILTIAIWLVKGFVPWTAVFFPIVLLPLIGVALGLAWALAAIGVFLRDVAQPIGLLMTILLFLSPVFYPVSALPQQLQPWLFLNPLTFIIEQMRTVMIVGTFPNAIGIVSYGVISLGFSWLGYAWFQKTRKGFANVL